MSCALSRFLPLLLLGVAALSADTAPGGLLGFSSARVTGQRALEQRFDAALDPAELKEWMRRLTARPHHVGSAYGKANAEFIAAQFRDWGFDTRIEEFRVLFPTPKTRVMEMVAPTTYKAALAEPVMREDATSGQAAEQLPTYNAYSVDGDVTGEVVYVNYGVPKDYEELERRGIDVKGKIALARYGLSWRGIKPKVAAEHGAIGCLIYSDPRDDGYFAGRRLPARAVPQRDRRPARLGRRHAPLSGRPSDAGRGGDAPGRQGHRSQPGEDADEDPRDADLLRRTRCPCSRRSAAPSRRNRGAARCP